MLFFRDLSPSYSLAFSADGRYLAAGGIGDGKVNLLLWDRYRGDKRTFALGAGAVQAVAFSPDGRWLAAASYRSVRLLNLTTGHLGPRFGRHRRSINSLTFSPGSRFLVSTSADYSREYPGGEANRWDLRRWQRGRPKLRASLREHPGFCSAVYLPGRRILLGCKRGAVYLWDVATKEYWAEFGPAAVVRSLAVSPDRRLLATAAGWRTHVWELESSEFVATLKGHQHLIRSVAFSPDGRTLLSGSWDGTVGVWDVPGGTKRACFDWGIGRIEAVAFPPDGQTAAAAGRGGLVIWDND